MLPAPDQFELRGYTHLPGSDPFDGIVLRQPGAARPEFFTKKGVKPPYIPGVAVEQWELRPDLLISAIELERVSPGTKFTKWQ
jgi:hypothetical protein